MISANEEIQEGDLHPIEPVTATNEHPEEQGNEEMNVNTTTTTTNKVNMKLKSNIGEDLCPTELVTSTNKYLEAKGNKKMDVDSTATNKVNLDQLNSNKKIVQNKQIESNFSSLLSSSEILVYDANPQDHHNEDLIDRFISYCIPIFDLDSIKTKMLTYNRQKLLSALCALLYSIFGYLDIIPYGIIVPRCDISPITVSLYWAHAVFNVFNKMSESMQNSIVGKLISPYTAIVCIILYHGEDEQLLYSCFLSLASFSNICIFSYDFAVIPSNSSTRNQFFYRGVFLPCALLASILILIGSLSKAGSCSLIVELQIGFMAFVVYAILFSWSVWHKDSFLEYSLQTRFTSLILSDMHVIQTTTTDNNNRVQYEKKKWDVWINIVCMMAISIIPYWAIPGSYYSDEDMNVFTMFYWIHTIFNVKKTDIKKSTWTIAFLYASVMYLLGVILKLWLRQEELNRMFWILGSFFNTCYFSNTILELHQNQIRPLFLSFFLLLSCLANALLFFSRVYCTHDNWDENILLIFGFKIFAPSTILCFCHYVMDISPISA